MSETYAGERPVHEFTVPASIGGTSYQTIGIVELTPEEEIRAAARAGHERYRLAMELSKQSLFMINGSRVREADGTLDRAWAGMPPKLRTLIASAYAEVHSPSDSELSSFLAGRTVRA